jgi:hypothetical protein
MVEKNENEKIELQQYSRLWHVYKEPKKGLMDDTRAALQIRRADQQPPY